MTTGLGTDFRWTVDADGIGDIDWEWSVEDVEARAYAQCLFRLITCPRLWYAPSKTLDVRGFLLDVATDAQIQIEIQQKIDADERTARSDVVVYRSGRTVDVAITAWDQRGRVHKMTFAISDVDGAILVGLR